ncbi:MAG: TIGR01212 family radical SAM protein [Prevotellaceae bacterium]|jgi:radical SAM protein (TIGR01212 family)|nr:TIGR01212 family radical SAM protein [Prevotellaceae bacterium]
MAQNIKEVSSSNQSYPWNTSRRFNSYARYFHQKFGQRLQKVAINAGFTCPNRDGTVAVGGCTFCDNGAFNPSYCSPQKSITRQIEEGIEFHKWRYKKAQSYLAYFQAFSNTHAPVEKLKELYEEALQHPQIAGLIVGTRPDCVDDEKLDYLASLSKDKYVSVEYGVESCYNKTLERINRGHTFEQAQRAIVDTAKRGINTGAHIIWGLPGETKRDMLDEAKILSDLPLHSIKFHQLQIVKNTKIAEEYEQNSEEFTRFEVGEYVDFFIDFLEQFNPDIVIERFAGEVPPRFLAHVTWGLIRNEQLLGLLDKRLEERDTWQGKLYNI